MSYEPTRRSLLKRVGIGGVGLSALSATAVADTGSKNDVSLGDERVWELLQEASDKEPFHAMYQYLLREGYYPNWDETTGKIEEIDSITRPVLLTPFESFDGEEAEFIVRFDDEHHVGVQAVVEADRTVETYYSSADIINQFEQDVLDWKQYREFAEGQVQSQDIKIGCKTAHRGEICAVIGLLGAAGTAVVSVASPVPGDESIILTLGKVESVIAGACNAAEVIDGHLNCEPDTYKVCLYTANLFFPYVLIKPKC